VVVLEEAAFIPEDVIYSSITPLLGVDKTAVLGISTPANDGNYYSLLLNKTKTNGTPIFRTIPVGLACQACTDAGKALECPHKAEELPDWKPPDRQELQKAMMPEEQYKTEALGLIPGRNNRAFSKSDIDSLFKRSDQHVHIPGGQTYVYIACDPTGGDGSRFALVAFVWAKSDELAPSPQVTGAAVTAAAKSAAGEEFKKAMEVAQRPDGRVPAEELQQLMVRMTPLSYSMRMAYTNSYRFFPNVGLAFLTRGMPKSRTSLALSDAS
jgi:hypothetical protein